VRRVADRYRILREVSAGRQRTCEALDEALDRPVALKELRVGTDGPDGAAAAEWARFTDEALTGASVDHPHIVKTFDAFTWEGRGYLVLEWVDGTGLDVVLAERGSLPVGEAVEIVCQVLDALETAGKRGVVHRDIKPSNVILSAASSAKIVDFGIAAREGASSGSVVAGTPGYMAPEQLRGRPVDRRTDIFSTGVLLYTLLSGRRPFAGESVRDVLERIEYDEPRMPSEWPPGLCAVIRTALAKEPSSRYQTAAEMWAALEPWRGAKAVTATTSDGAAVELVESLAAWDCRAAIGGIVLYVACTTAHIVVALLAGNR
jgi:serine/threonine protein kinase